MGIEPSHFSVFFPCVRSLPVSGPELSRVQITAVDVRVAKARRQKLDDEALRAVVQSVLPLNLGALLLSVIGLMLVMVGIFLS